MWRLLALTLLWANLHATVAEGVCPTGFFGPQCGVCESDSACATSTNVTSATCSREVAFSTESVTKAYSCEMGTGFLASIVAANSTFITCATGVQAGQALPPSTEGAGLAPSPESSAPSAAGSCDIGFTINSTSTPVLCQATDCSMSPGDMDVYCGHVTCACTGACPAGIIADLITSVSGTATMDCDAGGACSVVMQGLPIASIDVQCQVGECLVPVVTPLADSPPPPGEVAHRDINPFIAAIPLLALVTLLAGIGGYAGVNRHLFSPAGGALDAEELHRIAHAPADNRRVGTLTFVGLGVTVPMNPRLAAKKRAAMQSKAVRRTATSHVLHAHPEDSGVGALLRRAKQRLGVNTSEDAEVPTTLGMSQRSSSTPMQEAAAAEFVAALHDVPAQRGQWAVLGGISGVAYGGQVVGVLGPSGCGKTSFLGSIAGAAMELGSSAVASGQVLVDGQQRQRAHVAYVPQSDVLIPSLTVQECLRYSALLRLPVRTSPMEIQLRIDHVVDELGLQHVVDSQVGGTGAIRGISGGERRRVTIGMELVTDPGILVLDEPTSGLDSFTALNLMRTLRQVAGGGRVVVASLHQPSHDMFCSLDSALLMSHGRILYHGAPGEADTWFRGRDLPCPPGTALAEHLLKVASNPVDIQALLLHGGVGSGGALGGEASALAALQPKSDGGCHASPDAVHEQQGSPSVDDTQSSSAGSADPTLRPTVSLSTWAPGAEPAGPPPTGLPQPVALKLAALEVEARNGADALGARAGAAAPHSACVPARPGFARQLAVMTWRTGVDILRNPTLLRLHLVVGALMGVVTGLVFWQLDSSNVGVQNRMGGTFFALAFLAFTSLTTMDLLINERAVVVREVRGGYYRPAAYLISKLTLDAVFLRTLPAILYWASFYYMAGFRDGAAYQATYLFLLITFSCALGALSMAVTVASNTAGEASFGMNFIILFSIMFTGFLVNVNSIPAYLRWIHYLSVFFFAFEAMITNEMTGRTFSFNASGYSAITGINGDTYLATLGFDAGATTRDIGVLVGMYAAFTLLCLLLMQARMPHGTPPIRQVMRRLSHWH